MSSKSKSRKECSISPPTYCVEEDELGELINPEWNVKYPQRPRKGRYSLARYLRSKKGAAECSKRHKRREKQDSGQNVESEQETEPEKSRRSGQELDKSGSKSVSRQSDCYERQTELSKRDCRCTCDGCCQHSRARSRLAQKLREEKKDQRQMGSDRRAFQHIMQEDLSGLISSNCSDDDASSLKTWKNSPPRPFKTNGMPVSENLKRTIVGPQTAKQIEQMLLPTQFLLYYRRADRLNTINDLPINEPLTIAYKSSNGQVFHYRMKYAFVDSREKMWFVDLGPGTPKQPPFYSLDKLINYYKVFAFSSEGDNIDFF